MFRNVPKDSGYLFASRDLREVLAGHVDAMRREVEGLDADRLLNTSPTDLADYLVQKYTLEVPVISRDQMVADGRETEIDVSQDQRRYIRDRSQPFRVRGQRIEITVPFTGEAELFFCRASTATFSPPRAQVSGQSLVLTYDLVHDGERDLRPQINAALNDIEQNLGWVKNDVDVLNRALQHDATQAITARRKRLLANQDRLASLGIPLRERTDTPRTYAVPEVRRKIVPSLPPASTVPYAPEPVLDMEHYEHVLTVIQNMAMVMERSPSAFATMGEEDLRQHFLVQLNGHFEGRATGETFNAEGKTDILLRENGRNVFIAECKFWKGPKKFLEGIDQLLSYTAWRDTKTAILVFNRGTDPTTVMKGVLDVGEKHPNWKRTVDWEHESGYRFVFHHGDDRNRELVLTVLVFQVPEQGVR